MAFYDDMATVARKLIDEFGATITISRVTGETFDRVAGTVSGGSTSTFTPKGIIKNYKKNEIDGTRILAGDRLLVLDDTVEPLMDDTISSSGDDWNIVDVEVKNPAGTPLVYFAQIRR